MVVYSFYIFDRHGRSLSKSEQHTSDLVQRNVYTPVNGYPKSSNLLQKDLVQHLRHRKRMASLHGHDLHSVLRMMPSSSLGLSFPYGT